MFPVIRVLVVFLALASAASAQSHLADSSGVFTGLTDLSFGSSGSALQANVGGVVGYRQANGLDYGLGLQFGHSGTWASIRISPQIGLTRDLGSRFFARTEGTLSYSQGNYNAQRFTPGSDGEIQNLAISASGVTGAVSAGLGREVRLVGSLKAHPSLGLYGQASRFLSYSIEGLEQAERTGSMRYTDGGTGSMRYAAGGYVELPLSFRLLGRDVTLTTALRGPAFLNTREPFAPVANGGIRINF